MNLNETFWFSMKGYDKKSKWVLNLEPLKVFVFDWIVSFRVSWKNKDEKKIKLRHFMLKNALFFSLKHNYNDFWMNFSQKCTHILVDLDNIQQRVAVDCSHGQNRTVVTECHSNKQNSTEISLFKWQAILVSYLS